jgi:hypothetical protein
MKAIDLIQEIDAKIDELNREIDSLEAIGHGIGTAKNWQELVNKARTAYEIVPKSHAIDYSDDEVVELHDRYNKLSEIEQYCTCWVKKAQLWMIHTGLLMYDDDID